MKGLHRTPSCTLKMNSLPGVIFGLNMHRAKSCVSARRNVSEMETDIGTDPGKKTGKRLNLKSNKMSESEKRMTVEIMWRYL